jgi:hypothetical protein
MSIEDALHLHQRRCQLWHNSRLACASYEEFRANLAPIERAVAAQLAREEETEHHGEV